jgi:hypothetical protein
MVRRELRFAVFDTLWSAGTCHRFYRVAISSTKAKAVTSAPHSRAYRDIRKLSELYPTKLRTFSIVTDYTLRSSDPDEFRK